MDTIVWGTKLWNLLSELCRVLNPKYINLFPSIQERLAYRRALILLLYSLRYVIPCKHCRKSYREYIKESPPEMYGDNLWEWEWKIHDKVNNKLDHSCNINQDQFQKRILVWTTFVSEYDVWDFVTVLALNYPKYEKREDDKEYKEKKESYYILLSSLSFLLQYIPTLNTISQFVSPISLTPCNIEDRIPFLKWANKQKISWAIVSGKSEDEIRLIQFSTLKLIESVI